jgi:hypothetical protein
MTIATANGGAVRGQVGSSLSLLNVTIEQCSAGESGGAMHSVGEVSITNSTVTSCQGTNQFKPSMPSCVTNLTSHSLTYLHACATAARAGAVAVDARSLGSAKLSGSTFTNNIASQSGGALFIQSVVVNSSVTNCTFLKNSSPAGGGLFIQEVKPMVFIIEGSTFSENNSTTSSGGAILQLGTELRVQIVAGSNNFIRNAASCCYAGDDLKDLGGCLEISVGYGSSW